MEPERHIMRYLLKFAASTGYMPIEYITTVVRTVMHALHRHFEVIYNKSCIPETV